MHNQLDTYPAPQGLVIRRGTTSDATALAAFAAWSFADTYAHDHSGTDMADYMAAAFSPAAQATELADPQTLVLVATPAGGGPVQAYAMCVTDPQTGDEELRRLYIHPDWKGRGVAQSLMEAIIEHARSRNAPRITLSVWDRNERAISFYRRWGFAVIGIVAFTLGREIQNDLEMGLPL
jgi:ribosomal protein S18 acetylase RimI-like enzyme